MSDSFVADEDESGRMICPQMPHVVWRKIICNKKIADGTWLDHVEWRQNQGLQPKRKNLGKKRAANTSASSVVANAAAELWEALAKLVCHQKVTCL